MYVVPLECSFSESSFSRITKERDVSVTILPKKLKLFENTIEGAIYDILNRKKEIIRTVMGDGIIESTGDVAEEILKLINKRG
jgi:hypothetical protein